MQSILQIRPSHRITQHYAVAASLPHPTNESPSTEDSRLQQSPGGGEAGGGARPARTTRRRARARGRAGGRIWDFWGLLGLSRPEPRRGSVLLPHLPSSPTCCLGIRRSERGGKKRWARGRLYVPPGASVRTRTRPHGTRQANQKIGPRPSAASEQRGDDPDGWMRTVVACGCGRLAAGGHRHVMSPECVAVSPAAPGRFPRDLAGKRAQLFVCLFVFFSFSGWGTHVRRHGRCTDLGSSDSEREGLLACRCRADGFKRPAAGCSCRCNGSGRVWALGGYGDWRGSVQ